MAFNWYNWCLMCWENGTITETQLQNAVLQGKITQEQKDHIVNEVEFGVNSFKFK